MLGLGISQGKQRSQFRCHDAELFLEQEYSVIISAPVGKRTRRSGNLENSLDHLAAHTSARGILAFLYVADG